MMIIMIWQVPEDGLPNLIKALVGKEISVQISLNKENVTEDSTLFEVDDLYDFAMTKPALTESASISDIPTINLTTDVSLLVCYIWIT